LVYRQLPDPDGFEVAAAIRAREAGEDRTPIVALTANALSGDRERCIAAGMDHYLEKPIRTDALDTVIAATVDQRRPAHASNR
jgi:CheY-like chemotaxis protein